MDVRLPVIPPSPNNALQRTEPGGRLFSIYHASSRQPLSLSLSPLGHQRLIHHEFLFSTSRCPDLFCNADECARGTTIIAACNPCGGLQRYIRGHPIGMVAAYSAGWLGTAGVRLDRWRRCSVTSGEFFILGSASEAFRLGVQWCGTLTRFLCCLPQAGCDYRLWFEHVGPSGDQRVVPDGQRPSEGLRSPRASCEYLGGSSSHSVVTVTGLTTRSSERAMAVTSFLYSSSCVAMARR